MDTNALDRVAPWVPPLILLILMGLAAESCFAVGRRARNPSPSLVSTMQAAVLGLLGLLLGFTFSMAMFRYDLRWQWVVDEANAIGTTYLRSKLLPEPQRTQTADLLRKYVDLRVDYYHSGSDPRKLAGLTQKSDELQGRLWDNAVAVGRQDPHSVSAAIFTQSLNDLIDTQAKRLAALENQVPMSVFLLIYLGALLAMGLTGYASGIENNRNRLPAAITGVLIAAVVFLIADLDRPQRGSITVGQQSLIRLQQSIRHDLQMTTPLPTTPVEGPGHP